MADEAFPTTGQRALAWSVHLFTAVGVVLAFLALLAIERQQWREAWLWLFLALAVDGVDGTLARAARTRNYVPRIDGEALDLVIDYLSYVFLPALFIWRGDFLPASVALALCAAMLLSSLYTFARRDMKTADGYFRGFPALWNVIAFYFFIMSPDPLVAAGIIVAFVIMTFAPVHVVHPFRVRDYGPLLPALTLVWAAATAPLLLPLAEGARSVLVLVSLVSAGLLIGMGLLRSLRGPRPAPQ